MGRAVRGLLRLEVVLNLLAGSVNVYTGAPIRILSHSDGNLLS